MKNFITAFVDKAVYYLKNSNFALNHILKFSKMPPDLRPLYAQRF